MKVNRVIITGPTGAVGTALINECIKNNIEVLAICRSDSKRLDNIPKSNLVEVLYCPLEGLCTLENTTNKEYDVFFHFAWNGTINPYRNDMFLQSQNIKYALDAVKCAKRFGCKKYIGAGSQAEYGRFEGLLRETTPCFPENGYGIAKHAAGLMTRELASQIGIEHIWVRILSVYGPNDGSQSMVMSTINNFLNGDRSQFTKGEQIWDFLFSEDAARAFLTVAKSGENKKIYVLGSGNGIQLKKYIEIIRNSINPSVNLVFGEISYGEKQVMHLCADITDLNKLGWNPIISFEEGIKKTINSIKKKH